MNAPWKPGGIALREPFAAYVCDESTAEALRPIASELGQDYLTAMGIAGEYAYAGREWVVGRVLDVLGAQAVETVHNHHNFAWFEEHGGRRYLVTRKGATPAFPEQRGFVGGSMGDDAVILEGVESAESAAAFYSTVHGAGRVMGRMQAAGKWKKGVCVRPGLIDWPSARANVRAKGVELRGAGADEAPGCYKRLPEVLGYHAGTVRVLHTLRPIGVAMAGAETHDPYKD
jgi:tRNA-splicing ligase RtcB